MSMGWYRRAFFSLQWHPLVAMTAKIMWPSREYCNSCKHTNFFLLNYKRVLFSAFFPNLFLKTRSCTINLLRLPLMSSDAYIFSHESNLQVLVIVNSLDTSAKNVWDFCYSPVIDISLKPETLNSHYILGWNILWAKWCTVLALLHVYHFPWILNADRWGRWWRWRCTVNTQTSNTLLQAALSSNVWSLTQGFQKNDFLIFVHVKEPQERDHPSFLTTFLFMEFKRSFHCASTKTEMLIWNCYNNKEGKDNTTEGECNITEHNTTERKRY